MPRLAFELHPRDWLVYFLTCEHEGSESKAPVGTEPRRRYLHQHNLCSIMSAMMDSEAYSTLANAENPKDDMRRLRERFQAVPTLTDVDLDLCDSAVKPWFSNAWRATRMEVSWYNIVFIVTKRVADREAAMETLEKRARRGDLA